MFKNKFSQQFKSFFNTANKKNFSSNFNPNVKSTFMYGILGVSTFGLSYITYNNLKHSASYSKALLSSQSTLRSDIVHQRTRDTLVYFSSGLVLTAGLTTLMAKGKILNLAMNPFAGLVAILPTLYFMYKVKTSSDQSSLKPFYFLGFNACMAFTLTPFRAFIPLTILRDAGILTSGVFAGLALITATSKDDAFLYWSGVLGAGLGGLAALSIANIFFNSPVIFNIWLYGGLALFTAFTLYDMKKIQIKAKKETYFNAMGESIEVYMDFIQIFIRLAMIMNNRKNK
jgi:FtsH-binding integral membrane protein